MEDKGENPHFIIGWLSSMIDQSVNDKDHSMQESIDNGIRYFQNKAILAEEMANLQKVANEAKAEELYA